MSYTQKKTNLNWLQEGIEQNSDADRSSEELDQPGRTEQTQKADIYNSSGVDDTSNNGDEVKRVPRVFEVGLKLILMKIKYITLFFLFCH